MTNGLLGRILLTFLIAGPPVGALVFLAVAIAYEVYVLGRTGIGGDIGSGLPFIIAFGYLLGALPALLSGLVLALLVRRGWGFWPRLAAIMPAGALASLLVLGWFVLMPPGGIPTRFMLANLAVTGAIAALVPTLLLQLFPGARGS